jgi:hypothetical protein
VLVRQEQHLLAMAAERVAERPSQRHLGVGRRTDRAAVPTGERLDRGAGVHVGHRHRHVGDTRVDQRIPGFLDLLRGRHVGHRAACGEVGEHDLLVVAGQDVGRLGHEVHAAEDDVRRPGACGCFTRELERVAGHVRELDDFVALVVVTEDENLLAECCLGGAGAIDQRGVRWRGQLAGADGAALRVRIGLAAEQQQRERRGLDAQVGSHSGVESPGVGCSKTILAQCNSAPPANVSARYGRDDEISLTQRKAPVGR